MSSLLEQAHARLDDASRHARVPAGWVARIKHVGRTAKSTISIDLDDGSRAFFEACLCRHDEGRSPVNERVLWNQDITMAEVEARALMTTLKGALLDLPISGGAAAVGADLLTLSKCEFLRLEGEVTHRLRIWDPTGEEDAIALGGFRALEALALKLGLPSPATVSIHGFGRAGRQMARLLDDAGYVIVAASDFDVSVLSSSGLPVGKLVAAKEAGVLGAMSAERGIARAGGKAALDAECDLLIAAGPSGSVDLGIARTTRAKVLLELSNGAVASDADLILEARGIKIIPDILASATGPANGYLDRRLDGGVGACRTEAVDAWLTRLAKTAAGRVHDTASLKGISMRAAAHVLALERDVASDRGCLSALPRLERS